MTHIWRGIARTVPALIAAGIALSVAGCGSASQSGSPEPVAQQQRSAPEGSGHGLCLDVNSALARSAVSRLGAAPIGAWSVGTASNASIEAGCAGVLSWMTVNTTTNHPYTHILFFTNGTYLGTATSEPYMYTMVEEKNRNTIAATYHWLNDTDPMCCPQGGPSVVTYTLNGTTVTANGQFPPHT
ncbi:LppP/LprE family lipoprotein [Nocardia sp. NPDC052001]|uniref:LppP/LprE family lipoprotein n=1 Tax=Nocardia sp. NPDC052001 TaxID=3154853 RepID=UPI003415936E